MSAGQRFCTDCGVALTAEEPAAVPLAERRVCSVLFADLVGFTPLSEARDPEQVRELLSRYFDVCRTVIGRYGGVVEKFIGDAAMAVWGTPVAVEGDAERAVRAAIDLVAAIADLRGEVGAPELTLRAGVVTGEVAVTLGATAEGMVAGDAVNTAARVQSVATPGTVWVDDATQRLASAAIEFASAGEHVLKGKAAPVRLWQAGRVLSGVGGSQRVDGLEAPLTGREAELRTVKELFHATAERRTPRLVVVSGSAGVGKSRLGWEFEKYIDGVADVALWHRGRCLSYGEGVAFWALAEIVRQRFAIAEDDTVDVASAKLVEGLGALVPDPVERPYVGIRLGRLLGVSYPGDGDSQLSREELFAGWRLFFERLAEINPVVLLIEDAQHADPALLDFIDHLIDWARSAPIYVLVFTRPELDERRPGWGNGRNRTALTLDPLDARSMDALLAALVPGMPSDAVATIAGQAQGNPLFAVETVRSLIDRDVVVPVEGEYRLLGDVGSLTVPDSLHALLAARLDALEPRLRSLVADAAVLGSTFPAEALVAVSGHPPEQVTRALAELLRGGVFEISADELSPQRGAYFFAQNMLRQVAYETLSRRDRKARHLAVAAHLRAALAAVGDDVSDVIARHYLDALNAVPDDPDAPELRRQAVEALIRAGERAARSGAPARAADTYARAAELTALSAEPSETANAPALWERAAAGADLIGAHADMIDRAERARGLYLAAGEDRAAARNQATIGRALGLIGRHAEARTHLVEALDVLRPHPDHDTVVAIRELSGLEVFAGQARGEELVDEALTLGQALDVSTEMMTSLLIMRGIAYNFSGRNVQAAAMLEHAARLAERAGDSAGQGRALLNLSSVQAMSDSLSAMATARRACEYCRRIGARWNLAVAVNNLVFAMLARGDWDDAAAVLAEAMGSDGLAGDDAVESATAFLAALRGDTSAAAEHAVLAGNRASADPQDLTAPLLVDACIAAAKGRADEALTHALGAWAHVATLGVTHERIYWSWSIAARAAAELGDDVVEEQLLAQLDEHPIGHLPMILRAERSLALARLAAKKGAVGADAALADAVELVRAAPSPYHLAHALLDRATHLNEVGDGTTATELIDEAVEIAGRLRSGPLLDRAAATRALAVPA